MKGDDEGDGKIMYTKCTRKRAGDLNVKTNEMFICYFNKQTWDCGFGCSDLEYGPVADCLKDGNKISTATK